LCKHVIVSVAGSVPPNTFSSRNLLYSNDAIDAQTNSASESADSPTLQAAAADIV
jgi:hypothetical protein